jgi:hypothetical protein
MKKLIYKTFNEWSSLDFLIIKGSKSCKKNVDGVSLFSNEQVRKKITKSEKINFLDTNELDYSEDAEFWANANPNALYKYLLKYPEKSYKLSDIASARLAKNIR